MPAMIAMLLAGCAGGRAARSVATTQQGWHFHTVKQGDTLSHISRLYGVGTQTLADDNRIRDPRTLEIGRRLRIRASDVRGVRHTVRRGETLAALAREYGSTIDVLAQVNRLRDPNRLVAGQQVLIPGTHQPRDTQVAQAAQAAMGRQTDIPLGRGRALHGVRFIWPMHAPFHFTSGFGMRNGRMHNGIDLAAPGGTPVLSAADGTVSQVGDESTPLGRSAGNYLIVRHAQGVHTCYFHNQRVLVRQGQRVRQGQVIAHVGNTGRTRGHHGGYHLHFEVRDGVHSKDPLEYLPTRPQSRQYADQREAR